MTHEEVLHIMGGIDDINKDSDRMKILPDAFKNIPFEANESFDEDYIAKGIRCGEGYMLRNEDKETNIMQAEHFMTAYINKEET